MPCAGSGPLTFQAQVEESRAEAIDPMPAAAARRGALAAEPGARRYGCELGQQVGLKAGSLYPLSAWRIPR